MPFEDGVFLNVSGATSAAAGQTIQSVVWNNIHSDYSGALNVLADQQAGTPSFKNIVWMNGGFEIWQRGDISVPASDNLYTSDRWYLAVNANQDSTVTDQTGLSDTSALCARVQRTAGQTGTTLCTFGYPLDSDECQRLRGKFCYVSFKARAGANYSPTSGTISIHLNCGTGTPAKSTAGYTNLTQPIAQSVVLTTTTQTFQIISSVVVPITTTQAQVGFTFTPVGTAGAADYFEVDDVMVVAVPATDIDNYIPDQYENLPFSVQLKGCMSHFAKTFPYAVAVNYAAGNGQNSIPIVGQAAEIEGALWEYPGGPVRINVPAVTLLSILATASTFTGFNGSASVAATLFGAGQSNVLITGVPATTNVAYGIHAVVSAGI